MYMSIKPISKPTNNIKKENHNQNRNRKSKMKIDVNIEN